MQDVGNTLEINQQFKPILYIYRLLYQNLMLTINQVSTTDAHTQKKNESKHNSNYQIKRTEEEKTRVSKTNPKQLRWQ